MRRAVEGSLTDPTLDSDTDDLLLITGPTPSNTATVNPTNDPPRPLPRYLTRDRRPPDWYNPSDT